MVIKVEEALLDIMDVDIEQKNRIRGENCYFVSPAEDGELLFLSFDFDNPENVTIKYTAFRNKMLEDFKFLNYNINNKNTVILAIRTLYEEGIELEDFKKLPFNFTVFNTLSLMTDDEIFEKISRYENKR